MDASKFMPDEAMVASIAADLKRYNGERAVAQAEVSRRRILYFGGYTLAMALVAAAMAWLLVETDADAFGFVIPIAAFCLFGYWIVAGIASAPARRLQQSFRDTLLPRIFGFIGNVSYAHGRQPPSFSRLPRVATGHFNRTKFQDVFAGRYEGFEFELYETTLTYKGNKSSNTVFDGVVLAFGLTRRFPGTLVAVKSEPGIVRFFRDLFDRSGLETIEAADPALAGLYEFRSDNPDAARSLVSGRFTQALDWLKDAWPGSLARVALQGEDGFLLIPTTKDFFELPHISVETDYQAHVEPIVAEMVTLLATAALVRQVTGEADAAR